MRQVKWTAKPARARYLVRALGALLLGTATLAPALAQVTPPDPATKAAMEKRTAARTLLSSSLARIAANNSDTRALLDAGRASIDLEDYRAALGFLVRAEQASPRDGSVKAALGSAMVHMENPTRALDYFGEAQLMGAPERLFLADRGLARDLLGQQDAAQRDYQLALSVTPTDELTRRDPARDDPRDERPRQGSDRYRQCDDAARHGAEYHPLSAPAGPAQSRAAGRGCTFRSLPQRPARPETRARAGGGRFAAARCGDGQAADGRPPATRGSGNAIADARPRRAQTRPRAGGALIDPPVSHTGRPAGGRTVGAVVLHGPPAGRQLRLVSCFGRRV